MSHSKLFRAAFSENPNMVESPAIWGGGGGNEKTGKLGVLAKKAATEANHQQHHSHPQNSFI